jgi:hypothetical protein
MKYGVPLPKAVAGAGVPAAAAAVGVDSDDDDDLGDIQNDMLDAGIVPDADGALPLSKIITVLDDAEELNDNDQGFDEVVELNDAAPASAAAPAVRRSARQSARKSEREQAAIKRLEKRLKF